MSQLAIVRRRRVDKPVLVVAALTPRDGARNWLRNAISAYLPAFDVYVKGVTSDIAMTFGTEKKTRMVWPLAGEKKIEDTFIRFDRIHERNIQTDRHTDIA